ncbi:phage tail domain-containing protein [Eubacterium ventriosum]|uniref:phage tail domain-containing protein n=1 Tax=Eubacterium ventriosum TaxID=39496 RepID=UPI00265DAE9D|nr:phage tail domain-containing protein [Eubacterium ventriosum]
MFKIAVENDKKQSLDFSDNKNYIIAHVDGLNPVNATINMANFVNLDGATFNSARIGTRNIILEVVIRGNIEQNRLALERHFQIKKKVRLYYSNNSVNVYIDGYVESYDTDLFEQTQKAQISILCERPNFKSVNEKMAICDGIVRRFTFPFSVKSDEQVGKTVRFENIEEFNTKNAYIEADTKQSTTPSQWMPAEITGLGELVDDEYVAKLNINGNNVDIPLKDSNGTGKLYAVDGNVDTISCEDGEWFIERNTQMIELTGEENWTKTNDMYMMQIEAYGHTGQTFNPISNIFKSPYETNMHGFNYVVVQLEGFETLMGFKMFLAQANAKILVPTVTRRFKLKNLNDEISKHAADTTVISMNGSKNIRFSIVENPIVFGELISDKSGTITLTSTTDIGVNIQIRCKGTVVNPSIHLLESNEFIKLNKTFVRDDVITINTRIGEKSIIKSNKGVVENAINYLDENSTWLKLSTGENNILQIAESGEEYMETIVTYSNEYEGV